MANQCYCIPTNLNIITKYSCSLELGKTRHLLLYYTNEKFFHFVTNDNEQLRHKYLPSWASSPNYVASNCNAWDIHMSKVFTVDQNVLFDPGLPDVVLISEHLDRSAEVLASILGIGSKFLFYAQDLVVLCQSLRPAWSTSFDLKDNIAITCKNYHIFSNTTSTFFLQEIIINMVHS